jgi:soluble lytic murein transglycosylase-like protein
MTESTSLPFPAKPPNWPRDITAWPAAAYPFHDLLQQNALRFGLRPDLIAAVCEQESDWNPWAMRFEPEFLTAYVPPAITNDTERIARACSWGLMQVMGQTAREAGFSYPFLSGLCEPENGMEVGCRVLLNKLNHAGGVLENALLLWNGGGNKAYPGDVLARMAKYA